LFPLSIPRNVVVINVLMVLLGHNTMIRALFLIMIPLLTGTASLPLPVASTYASLDPAASADFLVEHFGAETIDSNYTTSSPSSRCGDTMEAWVKLPTSNYEFHFITTPKLANPDFSFQDFVDYVQPTFGNLSEVSASTYTQFMDFHVGMITDDMTPFYSSLKDNDVPFFMVGQYPAFFDLFVEIPGTATILEITSQRLDIEDAPISEWDICQMDTSTTIETDPQPLSAMSKGSSEGTEWPTINWRKTTFAAPKPALAELFSIKYLGANHIQQGHPGVWVRRCAKISWVEFPYPDDAVLPAGINYQFHFVDGYKYPPHDPDMTIATFADKVHEQRDFSNNNFDEFAHNRVTMWVGELTSYLEGLEGNEFGVEWILRTDGNGLFYAILDSSLLTGNVIELVSDKKPETSEQIKTWEEEFCKE